MSCEASMAGGRRRAIAGAVLVAVAGLIAGGCSSSSSSSSTLACPSKHGAAVTGNAPAAAGARGGLDAAGRRPCEHPRCG